MNYTRLPDMPVGATFKMQTQLHCKVVTPQGQWVDLAPGASATFESCQEIKIDPDTGKPYAVPFWKRDGERIPETPRIRLEWDMSRS